MSQVIKIQKGNRVIRIASEQKDSYLLRGYNVIGEAGEILEYATGGSSVSIAEYQKLLKENKMLKSQIEQLKQSQQQQVEKPQRQSQNGNGGGNSQRQSHK